MRFQNQELAALAADQYSADDLLRVETALRQHGTLSFSRLPSGLFPACGGDGMAAKQSGYDNVWVRDNVYIAYAHLLGGQPRVAVQAARTLLLFFERHRRRFDDIIGGIADPLDDSQRPHVRFDGVLLTEISNEQWPHAQNDALGYALWLCTRLAHAGQLPIDDPSLAILKLFPPFFDAIRYWEDEDSGHWEERRKISASSIGVVVAGLESLLSLAGEHRGFLDDRLTELVRRLIGSGRSALTSILPHECAQIDPRKNRRYDSALLFLIWSNGSSFWLRPSGPPAFEPYPMLRTTRPCCWR
jgi:phosphorylase kinase alpha/beta subunit